MSRVLLDWGQLCPSYVCGWKRGMLLLSAQTRSRSRSFLLSARSRVIILLILYLSRINLEYLYNKMPESNHFDHRSSRFLGGST